MVCGVSWRWMYQLIACDMCHRSGTIGVARDSSVCIATRYELDGPRIESRVEA